MSVDIEAYSAIKKKLTDQSVNLVAVSKFKSVEDIKVLYDAGQRDFGENFVQELLLKQEQLPKDINWHFIGHLQSNKVKYIAGFIHLIHGVDSAKLLLEINKQAKKCERTISCLLQVYIAEEETKYGFSEKELSVLKESESLTNVEVKGLMGMASFTEDKEKIKNEFSKLATIYKSFGTSNLVAKPLSILSMGMSSDYEIATQCGSNMVRIGSLLFGSRTNSPS